MGTSNSCHHGSDLRGSSKRYSDRLEKRKFTFVKTLNIFTKLAIMPMVCGYQDAD